ncbi:hypothetical protein V6N13_129647 [Hibiscus sabdariffa]|uniref:Uncharacterized protein n=1 Tax=Hibiscus sabdariffa TaxID=183260 RepID=A0ABR2SLS6_9ROSI
MEISRHPYRERRATASRIRRRTKRHRNQERSETRARGENNPNQISNNNLETWTELGKFETLRFGVFLGRGQAFIHLCALVTKEKAAFLGALDNL